MSGVVLSPPTLSPHQHRLPQNSAFYLPRAPPQSTSYHLESTLLTSEPDSSTMSGRKRKADDDDIEDTQMDRPSLSPSPGPSALPRPHATRAKHAKRARSVIVGRPLSLPRLLETLSPDQLRSVLRNICDQHPDISSEISSSAPRPSVESALSVLASYEASLRESFPYGDRASSDYAYNRVRQSLVNLIDALKEYTPNFLPPSEQQPATALQFLDGATEIIHRLPEWDSYLHNRHKQDAYEEMALAWALVVRESAKRGGGIQLQYNGWDQKLAKHNEMSGGKMQDAVTELQTSLGWMEGSAGSGAPQQLPDDILSIRQQLLSNTYGANNPIQVGPW